MAELIPLDQVPSMLPTHPDRSTIYRWVRVGCGGARLRTISVGRTQHTTEAWLLAFFEELTKVRTGEDGGKTIPTPERRDDDRRSEHQSHTQAILRKFGLSETG